MIVFSFSEATVSGADFIKNPLGSAEMPLLNAVLLILPLPLLTHSLRRLVGLFLSPLSNLLRSLFFSSSRFVSLSRTFSCCVFSKHKFHKQITRNCKCQMLLIITALATASAIIDLVIVRETKGWTMRTKLRFIFTKTSLPSQSCPENVLCWPQTTAIATGRLSHTLPSAAKHQYDGCATWFAHQPCFLGCFFL